jgi:anthranilate synthase component 1
MHIGSTCGVALAEGKNALDAIVAILPRHLSGAPKIRACQLITNLRGRQRGITAARSVSDFAGNMDTCIAIRIATARSERCYPERGGQSSRFVREKEYEECLNKAAAVSSLQTAERDL